MTDPIPLRRLHEHDEVYYASLEEALNNLGAQVRCGEIIAFGIVAVTPTGVFTVQPGKDHYLDVLGGCEVLKHNILRRFIPADDE